MQLLDFQDIPTKIHICFSVRSNLFCSKIMISIYQYAADLFVAPHILLDMHDSTGENMRLNMTLTSSFHDLLEIHIVQRTLRLDLDVPHEDGFHGVKCHDCQCIKAVYSLLETIREMHEGIGGKLLFTIGINHYGRERVLTLSKKAINIPQSKWSEDCFYYCS